MATVTKTLRYWFWKDEAIQEPPAFRSVYVDWAGELNKAVLHVDVYLSWGIGLDNVMFNGQKIGEGDAAAHATFDVKDLVKKSDNFVTLNYTKYLWAPSALYWGKATVYLDVTFTADEKEVAAVTQSVTEVNKKTEQTGWVQELMPVFVGAGALIFLVIILMILMERRR